MILCLLARRPDLDELEVYFGCLGSLLMLAASLRCHLGLTRVASMSESAIWHARRGGWPWQPLGDLGSLLVLPQAFDII